MIRRDRELLTRAAEVNRGLGAVVADLMAHQDDGQLPAERMRALGRAVCWLGADFLARAAELDGRVVDPVPRYLIDPRAGHTTLSHAQWEALAELFGRVCERGGSDDSDDSDSSGDLHELAAEGLGILECSRPTTWPRLTAAGSNSSNSSNSTNSNDSTGAAAENLPPEQELRARAHRVIGLLARLADSPSRDERAVHDTGRVVHALALWLLAYPGEPEDR